VTTIFSQKQNRNKISCVNGAKNSGLWLMFNRKQLNIH